MSTQNPDEAAEGREPQPAAAGSADGGTATPGPDEIWAYEEVEGENVPATGIAATFLPGLEALAVLAGLVAVLGAAVYLLVYPLVQVRGSLDSWDDYKNKVPQSKQDPFAVDRNWINYQSWGHLILGVVAMVLALVVLGLWTYERNKLWARSVAQAALVLGLLVAVWGLLIKTGVVAGGLPSMSEIQDTIAKLNASSGAQ